MEVKARQISKICNKSSSEFCLMPSNASPPVDDSFTLHARSKKAENEDVVRAIRLPRS